MCKNIILLFFIILLSAFSYGEVFPNNVVNVIVQPFTIELDYYSLNNGSLISKITQIPNPGIIGVVEIDFEKFVYISYSNEGFNYNLYDIETSVNKIISTVEFTNGTLGYDVDFEYQSIITNQPNDTGVYTIYGKNSTGFFFPITINFSSLKFSILPLSLNPILSNSYYSGGYDYITNTFYSSFISNDNCLNYLSYNLNNLQPSFYERCIKSQIGKGDKIIPYVYNSTKYIFTAYSQSQYLSFELFDIDDVIDRLPIYIFYNIPNDSAYLNQPINYLTANNQFITIAIYSSLYKLQYVTINMNDYSMSSIMIPLSSVPINSIYTF